MEHNHNPLIYGFALSIGVFIMGAFVGFMSSSGTDWQSVVTLQFFGGLMIVAGIIMLRGTFKKRDECPICKEKYNFGRKK